MSKTKDKDCSNGNLPSNSMRRWTKGYYAIQFCVLILGLAAIGSSVLTIFSCKFFSYKELDVFDDGNSESNDKSSDAAVSFEPFEYLPKAGVGLFSYYMGDPTGMGVMLNHRMCFSYCDEFSDYQWLSVNNNKGADHYIVDIWVLSRYCSIFAPSFGLLAILQIFFELICGHRMSQGKNLVLLKTELFLIAYFFQIATFSVLFAPQIMSSTSAEDLNQQFCFTKTSTVTCILDTGSLFSLGSTLAYLLLAFVSFCIKSPSTTDKYSKHDSGGETDESGLESDNDIELNTSILYIKRKKEDETSVVKLNVDLDTKDEQYDTVDIGQLENNDYLWHLRNKVMEHSITSDLTETADDCSKLESNDPPTINPPCHPCQNETDNIEETNSILYIENDTGRGNSRVELNINSDKNIPVLERHIEFDQTRSNSLLDFNPETQQSKHENNYKEDTVGIKFSAIGDLKISSRSWDSC